MTIRFPKILQDDAERKWQEFCDSSSSEQSGVVLSPEFIPVAKQVFVFSEFIFKNCIRYPNMLAELIGSGDLEKSYPPEEYSDKLKELLTNISDESDLSILLRQFRRREMIRIAWRDLAGMSDLSETMKDLSLFADSCVQAALSYLYEQQTDQFGTPVNAKGEPQQLVVLGMGKLGAYELNFSSDIDLIFAYPELGETVHTDRNITNDEFFVKLCRKLLNVLSANLPEGFVFRVDMGLRPYGEGGPLVMNFDAMEAYYQMQGREWERYAWIKARVMAGDKAAGEKLLHRLNPFIYRRYLDFGLFESLREMKGKIALEVLKHAMRDNIKLGSGGIREIEFFGQIFQLIRGGIVRSLQERRIQKVLDILVEENIIEPEVCDQLQQAYIFLRNTEHRLQEYADMQTHQLPSDDHGKICLAVSMGFPSYDAFYEALNIHREYVHSQFHTLLEVRDADERNPTDDGLREVWQNSKDKDHHLRILAEIGFQQPAEILQTLDEFRSGLGLKMQGSKGRERLDRLIPIVMKAAAFSDQPDLIFNRVMDLIRSIEKRVCYISLLLEKPQTLTHLVKLASRSSWILSFLSRHPVVLDELLDSRTLYSPPQKNDLERELKHRLEQFPPDDLEIQMETLRVFKQVNILRVAVADVHNALSLMKVSDHLSYIAETVLEETLELSWNYAFHKYGMPSCSLERGCQKGFAVIAYGKLGGLELGYNSDIDLVFIHAGTSEDTAGDYPIDSAQFFARLGQRVVHLLTTHTQAGILYEADMRLRPDGSSGPLVCHIDSFYDYQNTKAWTWEKQALLRARPVSGDPHIASRFQDIRKEVLTRAREKARLREEVRSMRQRMRSELSASEPGMFDLKQDKGGIVDIEFLVQYLVLLHAHDHPEIIRWTDNVRLLRALAECGAIDEYTAYFLRRTYLSYRAFAHKLSLHQKPAKVPSSQFDIHRQRVEELWNQLIGA